MKRKNSDNVKMMRGEEDDIDGEREELVLARMRKKGWDGAYIQREAENRIGFHR